MRFRAHATGRKAGAIGISHPLGFQDFELPNRGTATEREDAARAAFYAAGYEHVSITSIVEVK